MLNFSNNARVVDHFLCLFVIQIFNVWCAILFLSREYILQTTTCRGYFGVMLVATPVIVMTSASADGEGVLFYLDIYKVRYNTNLIGQDRLQMKPVHTNFVE